MPQPRLSTVKTDRWRKVSGVSGVSLSREKASVAPEREGWAETSPVSGGSVKSRCGRSLGEEVEGEKHKVNLLRSTGVQTIFVWRFRGVHGLSISSPLIGPGVNKSIFSTHHHHAHPDSRDAAHLVVRRGGLSSGRSSRETKRGEAG